MKHITCKTAVVRCFTNEAKQCIAHCTHHNLKCSHTYAVPYSVIVTNSQLIIMTKYTWISSCYIKGLKWWCNTSGANSCYTYDIVCIAFQILKCHVVCCSIGHITCTIRIQQADTVVQVFVFFTVGTSSDSVPQYKNWGWFWSTL